MKYPKYPAYKDSGVEWIGKIPEGWKVIKLKYLCYNHDSKRIPVNAEDRSFKRGNIPYWGANGIVDYVDDFLFNEELVLIGEDGAPFFERYKTVAFYLNEPIWPNNHVHVLSVREGLSAKYLTYSLNVTDYTNFVDGSTRDKLTKGKMAEIPIAVCNKNEQFSILNFLEKRIQKTDSLISNLQKMIELLKEKRQAIITHAVTKGLEPNVPMRDSGVEWIGEIPSSWNVVQTKWLMSCNDEVIPENSPSSFELTYVEISDVDFTRGITNRELMRFEDAPSRARRKVRDGDIIISTVRTYLKAIAEIKAPDNNLVVSTGFAVLRPRKVLQSFAKYALSASYFIEKVISESFGVSYPAITADRLISIKLAVPDIKTQEEIADLLDKQTMNIDSLVKKQEEMIDLLREHRFSLISSAVTGKIEVRNLKINEI